MQMPTRRGFIKGAAACCSSSGAAVWATPDLAGVWSGFLGLDDPPTLLTLRVVSNSAAELTIVGMGAIPLSRFRVMAQGIEFEVDRPKGSFAGTLNDAGDLVGSIRRGDGSIPLTFVRGDFYTEPAMPPLPLGPITADGLKALRTAAGCPAMGVAWQRGNGPVHVIVDGRRAAQGDALVQPTDRWHLGSVTKGMTATLAARMVERGKLTWTTPLRELLGSGVPDMHVAYRDLNLLHLLSHRGGLARDAPAESYAHLPPAQQRLAYVQAALKLEPVGEAGKATVYSNAGYVAAGLVLEIAGEAAWEDLIAKHVFDPLGVRDFGFGPPGIAGRFDEPEGHRMGARGLEPVRSDIAFALGPAGRVHMTLGDLALYLRAHRDRQAGFLKPASWDTLHTPPFGGNYALGWEVTGTGVLVHGGTNSWWKSEVRVDPRRRLLSTAVTNVLNGNGQKALLLLEDAAALS